MADYAESEDNPDIAAEVPDIAAEWAGEYDDGAELFVGSFDADDFDSFYGDADHPDGATIAVLRCVSKPPPGWIRKHAHLSDSDRAFALIVKHSCDKALAILDDLKDGPWNEFIERWGRDGGLIEGKSSRSARHSRDGQYALPFRPTFTHEQSADRHTAARREQSALLHSETSRA